MPKRRGRKLLLFNGRIMLPKGIQGHGYIAAYSVADAARVLDEVVGGRGSLTEIKVYWSHGCWGNAMDGITPERGLWVHDEKSNSKPSRYPTKKHEERK